MKVKKRGRKVAEFWDAMGETVNQTGEVTEKLVKNLGSEFQRLRQIQMTSGMETVVPKLRGSADLYNLYDDYYQLYFPHGGSIVPHVILTEKNSDTVS